MNPNPPPYGKFPNQKFQRGDIVRVANNTVHPLSVPPRHQWPDWHGQEAVVLGSWPDQYGDEHSEPGRSLTLIRRSDGVEASWFEESWLELVRHGTEQDVIDCQARRLELDLLESDPTWIVDNWASSRSQGRYRSLFTICKAMGISDPWGPAGEGVVLATNFDAAVERMDEMLRIHTREEVIQWLTR